MNIIIIISLLFLLRM